MSTCAAASESEENPTEFAASDVLQNVLWTKHQVWDLVCRRCVEEDQRFSGKVPPLELSS